MRGGLTRSRFRNVYFGLVAVWLAASLGTALVIDSLVAPKLLNTRAQTVESLVRSQREALLYNDNRATRDELLRQGIIAQDQDFEELRPSSPADRNQLADQLDSCKFITNVVCVNSSGVVILSDAPIPNRSPSFAILLRTQYLKNISNLIAWKLLGSFIVGLLLGFAAWAIRQQEKFLLGKIELLASSFSKIENSFRSEGIDPGSSSDEFSLLSEGLEQAGLLLDKKTDEIARFKRDFEKKTELEQLAKTISYTSHNLKAPILEGVDFFQNLPRYLDTMPREKLVRMSNSLEKRFRSAGESLQRALSQTRESYTQPENMTVPGLLRKFYQELKLHPHYAATRIELETRDYPDSALVFCSAVEMDAALWNLARNSIDAKSDAQIQIRAFKDGNHAVLHFQDDGPGVPEFLRDQIFDDFYTTKVTGNGLGLGSVKNTVNKYGGSVEAKLTTSGALFEIRLPLSAPAARLEVGHA